MGYGVHENSIHAHAAIEFASSELVGIRRESATLILDLKACVHRSREIPGVDPGSVWDQPASIVLENGRILGNEPSPPLPLSYGEITTASLAREPFVPCPLSSDQGVALDLLFESGVWLRVEADRIAIDFTGEERFLWDFPDY